MNRNGACAPKGYGELVIERDIALSQRDELLAALQRIVSSCEKLPAFTNPGNVISRGRLRAAQVAIARAEGKQS